MFSCSGKAGIGGKIGLAKARKNVPVCRAIASDRAAQREARVENVPGDFFVDHTCIGK